MKRRSHGVLAVTTLGLLSLAGCAQDAVPPAPDDAQAPEAQVQGRLVIVGGALSAENAEVYQAIVEARDGDGPLCVIPTASGDPQASMESSRGALARYAGSSAVKGILISTEDPSRAHAPSVAAEITACSGFYFTGGAQSRVVDVFLPQGDTTVAYRALWDRWQEGAVLAGSSAGAAMMSGVMIASGSSIDAVEYGAVEEEDGPGVNIRSGMGFFTQALLDQHFLARGRIGRLLVSTLITDSVPRGLGIDENTALVVDGVQARVVGASGVVIVDAGAAERTGGSTGKGIRVSLAGRGDAVDLRTLDITRGAGKEALPAAAGALDPGTDPFERWAFLHLVTGLASHADAEAVFSVAGKELRVTKGAGFSAVAEGPDGGVEGVPGGLSAGPFIVDLVTPGS